MASSGVISPGVIIGSNRALQSAQVEVATGMVAATVNTPLAVQLNGVAGRTTYLTSVTFNLGQGTAVSLPCTITGLLSGTWNLFPSMLVAEEVLIPLTFPSPIPASGINVAIIANIPASGATGGAISIAMTGFTI